MPELTADAWEQRYQTGDDPWDLGCPTTPLEHLLKSDQAPPPGRMAALGIGSGLDALRFAAAGFDVVGFDFAPSARLTPAKDSIAQRQGEEHLAMLQVRSSVTEIMNIHIK